jgi:SAM-dependent methyltransferase
MAVRAALEHCAADAALPALLAVDATCGNGYDTLFLAQTLEELCGDKGWSVLGFDVQSQALDSTRAVLQAEGCSPRVDLLLQSHERLKDEVVRQMAKAPTALCAVMYNLGYLPRSDKRVITRKESTLPSLCDAAALLAPRGILAVHAYGGHPGGQEEMNAVEQWCAALPYDAWQVARYALPNKPHGPETLFLIQRRVAL